MGKSIFLEKLLLKNFKGIKDLTIDFGKETNIYGDNATGKTTVNDAFTWLLFGKDSQDISKFSIQPLNNIGETIDNLETEVEGMLKVDDTQITLKKVYKQKWVRRRGSKEAENVGNTTDYYINEVPQKEKEYQKKINEIIPESIFKLLTNPLYFSSIMSWQDRRKIIFDMNGDVSQQDVIDSNKELAELGKLLNPDESIEDFNKRIKAKIGKLKKDRQNIPARIDELNMTIKNDIDFDALDFRKRGIVAGIKSIDEQLMDKTKTDDELFKKKDKLYGLQTQLRDIKYEEIEKAESGKDDIAQKITSLNGQIAELKFDIRSLEAERSNNLKTVKVLENSTKDLRDKWYEENAKVFELPENAKVCPLCKRPFDEEDIESHRQELEENFKQNKAEILKSIKSEGKRKSEELKKFQKRASENESAIKNANAKLETLNNKKAELQSKLDNFKINVDLDSNTGYQEVLRQVEQIEKELSKPIDMESQMIELKERKQNLQRELEGVDRDLSYREINNKTNARIKELRDKGKQLAQQIADLEKAQYLSDEFVRVKVGLLENSVNNKFKLVKIKLFNNQVNGGLSERCEVMVDGVPFSTNLNSGMKINAGLDIINTLSSYYKVNAPIFIDNKESVTNLIDTNGQIINLIVNESDKKLRIENNDTSAEQTEMAS